MENNEKISEILNTHDLISLATVNKAGKPKVRSIDFVMGDDLSTLYFFTSKATDKVGELRENKNVHITVDHPCASMEELLKLQYLKAEGIAELIETPEGIQEIFGRIIQKFPYLSNMPGDPSDYVGVKVKLNKIHLTDNTVSFGHTETISL